MGYKSDHIKVLKVLASALPKRPTFTTNAIVEKAFKSAEDGDRRVRNAYRMIRKNDHAEIADRGEYRLTQKGASWFEKAEKEGFKAPAAEKKAPAKKAPVKKSAKPKAKPKAKAKPKKASKAAKKPVKVKPRQPSTKPKAKQPSTKPKQPATKASKPVAAKNPGKSNGASKPAEAKKEEAKKDASTSQLSF